MDSKRYTIKLTDEQTTTVKQLFNDHSWKLELELASGHSNIPEEDDQYVKLQSPENGRIIPRGTDVQQLKDIGYLYKSIKRSNEKDTKDEAAASTPSQSHWSPFLTKSDGEVTPNSDIRFNHFLVADNDMITVVTKLCTEHVRTVSYVPVRIVLLIDESGSMLHKIGRNGRQSKITMVKHFAKKLLSSLDDECDQIAVVTFGNEADVFFPLQKINGKSRPGLLEKLNQLGKGTMSMATNLSAGLRLALKVFFDASKSEADYYVSKNSILVFTDGEINAGTTDTNSLIHEVRQNIRQMAPNFDESSKQWVTISVITTGTCISDHAYMLSKTCSSDAYYYINKDSDDPESELFLPVLLRKTAVAWNISYVVKTFHGLTFIDNKCSKDNRIRLQRSFSNKGSSAEKAYFMYDFPAGNTRHLGICAKWYGPESVAYLSDTEVLFRLRVEFTNINGERFWQEQTVTKHDVLEAIDHKNEKACIAAYKHELQLVSCDVLRSAAEHVKTGKTEMSKAIMVGGQDNIKVLFQEFGEKSREEKSNEEIALIHKYTKSVLDNLGDLIKTMEQSVAGETWNKMKALSTAIARESPSATDTLIDGDIICPMPNIDHMESGGMKTSLEYLVAKQNRNSFGVESLLQDTFM